MANLTRSAQLVKKIFLPVVYISVILILVFVIYRGFSKPESAPQQDSQKSSIESIDLSGPTTETGRFNSQNLTQKGAFPQSAAVYKTARVTDLKDKAQEISSFLGFTSEPIELNDGTRGIKHVYLKEGSSLSIFETGFSFAQFTTDLNVEGEFDHPLNLLSKTRSFLEELNLEADFSEDYQIKYFNTAGEFETLVNTADKANRIVVFAFYQISGIKVVGNNAVVTASFNRQNELRDILYNQFTPGEKIGDYQLIEPEQALRLLINHKGTLLEVETPSDFIPPPTRIVEADLTTIYPAYYNPASKNSTLQPVWIFEATSKTTSGDEVLLTYAVPAISQ